MFTEKIIKNVEDMLQCDFAEEWHVCLTKDNELMLMWSGYADTSFTITYDTEQEIYLISGNRIESDILQQVLKILER